MDSFVELSNKYGSGGIGIDGLFLVINSDGFLSQYNSLFFLHCKEQAL